MELSRETTEAVCVEAKYMNGDGWFTWASYGIAIDRAREIVDALRKQGREARIVKETTTTVREVLE